MRDFLLCLIVLTVACVTGCSCVDGIPPDSNTTSEGGGGSGGGSPCGEDCSKIHTPQCLKAVCNTGQAPGPLDTCVVVPADKGTSCDDGVFCTKGDACDNGTCVGGPQNDCGTKHSPCDAVICYEDSKSCDVAPVDDGTACTPTDLCRINGICQTGECMGEPKDCTFSPLSECNTVSCDPDSGKCVGTPDPGKDNAVCLLSGDACSTDKTCQSGECVGGAPKDCSGLDVGCQVGACHSSTGLCEPKPAPAGTACADGITDCQVGVCEVNGACKPSPAPDGIGCNDHNACTDADKCASGICVGGSPVAACSLYLRESFESCPHGWTFGGDWQCGTPHNVGPAAAHTGHGVIATQIGGVYHVNQSFNTCDASSPPIDLTAATNPVVSFWAWDHTEGGTFDGWNLKVSTNGGTSFPEVLTVTPAYPLTVAGQPSWGGDHSAEGWQNYSADLSAYAGQTIILRFAFHSDGATVFPGVYIDDIVVSEPLESPLYITTTSPLADVYEGMETKVQIVKVGGTASSVWSITPGGVNTDWLSIDPTTGVLQGTPTAADVGPVSVTVHIEEPSLPSNFADMTFTFNVNHDIYYTSFEGACPAGWTLTGDWQCGVPANVGPPTAYVGTQCIATQIGANYHDSQSFATTTATSPDIDLTNAVNTSLTFRMWIDTEGSTYDGANLQVSTDGGGSYSVVPSVTPAYPLLIGGEQAWGGHEGTLGWQLIHADLSNYDGQVIRLRISFQSDSSGNFPGVYIDDFFVN